MKHAQKISTKKNPFNEVNTSVTQPVEKKMPDDMSEKKDHYYGSIKQISSINDISYLCRGSVYYLRDNPNDPDTSYHPYLVIQTQYLDKIGRVTVFGITSTPNNINMIPIVMKGTIGYINHHEPYRYNVNEFFEAGTRYVGTVVNPEPLDLAMDMYGLYLGMNLKKSEDEIISDYLKYVEEFKNRTRDLKPYKHRVLLNNRLDDLELKTSFIKDQISDDEISETASTNDIDEIYRNDNPKSSDDESDGKIIAISETGVKTIPVLEVDLNSDNILIQLSELETKPSGEVKLPRHIQDMTDDEKAVFLASIVYNGIGQTAILYNCSAKTVSNKQKQINNVYKVVYKDVQ